MSVASVTQQTNKQTKNPGTLQYSHLTGRYFAHWDSAIIKLAQNKVLAFSVTTKNKNNKIKLIHFYILPGTKGIKYLTTIKAMFIIYKEMKPTSKGDHFYVEKLETGNPT